MHGSRTPAAPQSRPLAVFGACLALAVVLAGCRRANVVAAGPVTVRVGGASSLEPALRDLADAFAAGHPEVQFTFRFSNSTAGLEDLAAGRLDVAGLAWLPEAGNDSAGLVIQPVARDAIAAIVHPTSPLRQLTLLQLRALYQGEVLDWAALGGASAEPIIVSREEGSGTRAAFEALVMGGERVTLNAVVMPNTAAMVEYVGTHKDAIGYVSMAGLDESVRAVALEEADPSAASVSAGRYHLARTLYIALPGSPPTAAQAFAAFVLSAAGQRIVGRHHLPLQFAPESKEQN